VYITQRLQLNLNKLGNVLTKSLGWKRMNGCQNYLTFEICGYLHILEICF